MPQSYDIVIVGGGPAGTIAALVAARCGRRVLLLEEGDYQDFKIGESLPPAANLLLRDLGLRDAFLAEGHLPCYGNLAAWGGDELHGVDFINDPHGHGWHLDRRRFDRFLCEKAESAGAFIQTKSVFRRATFDKSNAGWQISFKVSKGTETTISCRWLVDASGRASVVARRNGAKRQAKDKLVAFLGILAQADDSSSAADEDSRTLVEATSTGWWYSALVPDRRRIAVFQTDGDLTRPKLAALKTSNGFVSSLKNAAHLSRLISPNDYRLLAPPQMKAACSARLDNFGGGGWLAAGDAAMSFDPISSQGIMTALYTGMKAGETLNACLAGEMNELENYNHNLNVIYDAYFKNLSACYAVENRWSNSLFWSRRHQI